MRVSSSILTLVGFEACTTFAVAATGDLMYKYDGTKSGKISDPPSRECINVPEVQGQHDPAHSPENHTNRAATL
ncbi:MAG: hypothetical protein JOS17DRAFT_757439 [Linnemannia elongata]|nr:MAG: hypothetical protein JOS17DRAFT_757439 [Linnemannia elongata]